MGRGSIKLKLFWGVRWLAVSATFICLLCFRLGTATLTEKFDAGKLSFSLKFNGETNSFHTTGLFVLPNEAVHFEVVDPRPGDSFSFQNTGGLLETLGNYAWIWRAPAGPGTYLINIRNAQSKETMTLNVFTMVPYKKMKNGNLNGYQIGSYPPILRRKGLAYEPPKGFIEVTLENKDLLVSPHLKLGQFLCKEGGAYPKYVVLRERLLYQMENILERVNNYGYRCKTLSVMSGFRTPYYNKLIHNVPYSRHLWGDAADIYIDATQKWGEMDDLNRDGKVDFEDGLVLRKIIQELQREPGNRKFTGGLGAYKRTDSHGPFVHVDVRGRPASW